MTIKKLKLHDKTLKEEVFFTKTKWPHFDILFKDINKFSKNKSLKNILSLERGSLYGNISILAPYFKKKNFISVDCSEKKILSRGSYNKKFVDNNNIIKIPVTSQKNYKKLNLKKNFYDLIVIPNLMHHIYDHKHLIKSCKKYLKKNGLIYVFEPTLREIHQLPEDYYRFTPYGMKQLLNDLNFRSINFKLSGGPFTAAAYCLDQASQFLPKQRRQNFKKEFKLNKINFFQKLDKKHRQNLFRKYTIFPMSFSITAKK